MTQLDRRDGGEAEHPGAPILSRARTRLRGAGGWLGPLLVTAFAAALRFFRLGEPHAVVFDETYYAKDALGQLKFGAPHETVKNANEQLLGGSTDLFTDEASFVVHPQFGKTLIAAGEWAFGANPFGWRFAAAVIGALSVLVLARLARRLTGSTLLGCVAGLLLALDGLHFTHSRLALLDIFVTFWVIAGFACLVADRDAARARLAERVSQAGRFGPALGLRPWRLAAGTCLGLACATKWSAVPFVAAFGLLVLAWDMGMRRSQGVRRPFLGGLLRDAVPAFASLVLLALAVYVATWMPWFLSDSGWARQWADGEQGWPLVPGALQSLWHYHQEIWSFHTTLDASHRYQSEPWTWLPLLRPVAYFYTSPSGCGAAECSRAIHGLGTPAIWWMAMPMMLVILWLLLVRRDWRAGGIVTGVAAAWLPWVITALTGDRTQFLFYALPLLPFLVLAITMCLGLIIGRADASALRRGLGAALAGAYLLVVIANFAYLYPVLSAELIPYDQWHARMWLESWI